MDEHLQQGYQWIVIESDRARYCFPWRHKVRFGTFERRSRFA
jgi:hypothetical protein